MKKFMLFLLLLIIAGTAALAEDLCAQVLDAILASEEEFVLTGAESSQQADDAVRLFAGLERWTITPQDDGIHVRVFYPTGKRILSRLKSGTLLDIADAQIYDMANTILDGLITPDMTDLEKETAIYDYLCDHCTYMVDMEHYATDTAEGPLRYNRAQCSGYSDAFTLLCGLAGLETYCVHGTRLATGVSHEWNLIRLDGLWYAADLTFGDTNDTALVRDAWLNLPVGMQRGTVSWDERTLPGGEYALKPDANTPCFAKGHYAETEEEARAICLKALEEDGSLTLLYGGALDGVKFAESLGLQLYVSGFDSDSDVCTILYLQKQ